MADLPIRSPAALGDVPRVRLATLPTPLVRLDRLSAHLGRDIWCKRDDLTGLAFGGNKTRQFEYLLGEAVASGCDAVVVGPYAAQSNFCRQLSAACALLGLRARLVLRAVRQSDREVQGNLLLDSLLGADVSVHAVPPNEHATLVAGAIAEERAAGYTVFDPESMSYLAAIAYVHAGLELFEQLESLGVEPAAIYLAAAGESQAGLILAAKIVGSPVRIVGMDPGVSWWNVPRRVLETGRAAVERLRLDFSLDPDDVINTNTFSAPGYALVSKESLGAIELLATTEGLLLDPVYTSKAMAGLCQHLDDGVVPEGPVVFIHTGGLPALFHYRESLGLPRELPDRIR